MSNNELKNIVSDMLASKPVSKAYLFGSYLYKTFEDSNDIDILIDLEPDNNFSLIDFSRLQIDLTEHLGKNVDLLTEEAVSPYILNQILNERILIYEK